MPGFLNWQTDPILLDSKPTPMSDWVTANKLFSTGELDESIFDTKSLALNIYSILIRKIDFVREKDSDRILSRFPFIVLTDDEKEKIKKKILLVAELSRDYFYRSINSGIMEWKRRLTTYLKRGAIPYPLYRCSCKILDVPINQIGVDELFFESARGKRYSLPTKLTNALVYLCGVINGDGHLHRHWLRITDETKEYMVLLSKLFEKLFNDSGELFVTGNAWNIELHSSSVSRIINFLTDQTIERAKYDSLREPLIIKQLGSPYRNLYWRGAMDADGSFKNQISFSSASERYTLDYQAFLESIGISSSDKYKCEGSFGLNLPAKDKLKYVEMIGALNPKKSDDLLDFMLRKRKYSVFNGIKKDVLTIDGYFNFDLLDSLFILGLGDLLVDYRAGRSYLELDNQFEIAQGSYSNLEKNNRALPYTMLKTILKDMHRAPQSFYEILEEKKNTVRFQVSSSNSITLPLKPNEKLESILPQFDPKINYVLVNSLDNQMSEIMKDIFDITITDSRVDCRLLVHFLETYFIYVDETPMLTVKEYYKYRKKWREEISRDG